MSKTEIIKTASTDYNILLDNVGHTLENGRRKAFAAVNTAIVETYWEIVRKLYITYPKSQTLSDQLTWSHYIELLMNGIILAKNA